MSADSRGWEVVVLKTVSAFQTEKLFMQLTVFAYSWDNDASLPLSWCLCSNFAERQTLITSVVDSSPTRFPGSPSTALRVHLSPWHSLSLSALCPPNESPMIPSVVIHCINEVTDRGILSAGLYRMSMMDNRVHSGHQSIACARDIPKFKVI